MKIAIIPAFNEGKTIKNVVKTTKKYVDKVIVVDDCSVDNTSDEATTDGVIVIKNEKNLGKSDSIKIGIDLAKRYSPNILIFLDGDGQHSPDDIPKLIKPIEERNVDVVYGIRKLSLKNIKSYVPGKIVDFLFGGRDVLCGFKAIRYDALKKLDLSKARGYLFELVLHKQIKLKKLKLECVPITAIGTTRIGWLKGIKLYFQYILDG